MGEYTEAEKRNALRLYSKRKWGCKRIASIIGCYPSTIKRWVERAGLEKHPGPAYPESVRNRIIAEYQDREDMSLEAVSKKHGISHETLRRWLRDEQIHIRQIRPQQYNTEGILRDIDSGMRVCDVAEKYSCSMSWVYQIRKRSIHA